MPVPSLLQLCTNTAVRNVKYLNDIGDVPYSLARPFLLKIESPEKLRSLELLSPQITQYDDELWMDFIKRDIPQWDDYDLPEHSDSWYEIYCNLRDSVQKSVDEDAERMKMALDGINSERAKHSAKFVTDRRVLPLPRERPTVRQRYAVYDRKMGGVAPVFSPRSGISSSDPFGPRNDTKKKSSIFTATKRNTALAVPTQHLNNRATQVRQAPRSLVDEHRRPIESPPLTRRKESPAMIAPGRSRYHISPNISRGPVPTMTPNLQEREARLRKIAAGKKPIPSPASRPLPSSAPSPAAAKKEVNPEPRSRPPTSAKSTHTTTLNPRADHSSAQAQSPPRQANCPPEQAQSPPRPVMARKRPAPSVFIQPKKKRVT
ncbi:elongin A domain-containing protein [Aspergillus candidus]|uniref:RNA polymerase II transcription factor SIII subunit A-domain-containing protein n=1 Tax=Aspergillus candidus TaxID=41067 RepID=A0A2I2FP91_ASPCN|nr:hypothetical protein BDW47DRAFT_97183 [Aspergillus candidus]PLB42444.1 hypothetical protein BDW47DRAFT_97183 [Aspergillus candidus]